MRRALAKWRWAGLAVVWDADDSPQATPVRAEVVHNHVHIHIHAPVPVGTDQAARIIQAAPERAAITEEGLMARDIAILGFTGDRDREKKPPKLPVPVRQGVVPTFTRLAPGDDGSCDLKCEP